MADNRPPYLQGDKNSPLEKEGHSVLEKMANTPDVDKIWARIVKICGEQDTLKMRLFICEIALNNHLSGAADYWPKYLANAKKAKSLASFLKACGRLPPPCPMEGIDELIVRLEMLAKNLCQRSRRSLVSVRRQNIRKSRRYVLFMQLQSLSMKDFFGRLLDQQVAEITNVLFPKAFATTDSVLAARRASTRAGRAAKGAARHP